MFRIGVLSDTHFMDVGLGAELIEGLLGGPFEGVDLILHAGDFGMPPLLGFFAPTPIALVRGNTDPPLEGIPIRRVVEVAGVRIGMIHGWGSALSLEDRVMNEFVGESLDCLVFGHSHQPCNRRQADLLLFNPGSPTDPRAAPQATVGLLEIEGGRINGRIINL